MLGLLQGQPPAVRAALTDVLSRLLLGDDDETQLIEGASQPLALIHHGVPSVAPSTMVASLNMPASATLPETPVPSLNLARLINLERNSFHQSSSHTPSSTHSYCDTSITISVRSTRGDPNHAEITSMHIAQKSPEVMWRSKGSSRSEDCGTPLAEVGDERGHLV